MAAGASGRTLLIATMAALCLLASAPAWSAPPAKHAGLNLDLSRLTDGTQGDFRPAVVAPVLIDGVRYHRVAAGETGIAIARAYGIAWSRFVAANGLTEPFVLRVGQALRLPASSDPRAILRRRQTPLVLNIDDIVTGGQPAVAATAPVKTGDGPGRFAWPASGDLVGRFGPQGGGRVNQGIDIATKDGAGVRAAASGTVAYVGNGVPGYGGLILVRHDGGWISAYGRVASVTVTKGSAVRRGQTVGRSGGDAPLHFELRLTRQPVDPVKYLPTR